MCVGQHKSVVSHDSDGIEKAPTVQDEGRGVFSDDRAVFAVGGTRPKLRKYDASDTSPQTLTMIVQSDGQRRVRLTLARCAATSLEPMRVILPGSRFFHSSDNPDISCQVACKERS